MKTDWHDLVLGLIVYALIAAACVVGHAAVSAEVAHGMEMPILYTDTFLPVVGK